MNVTATNELLCSVIFKFVFYILYHVFLDPVFLCFIVVALKDRRHQQQEIVFKEGGNSVTREANDYITELIRSTASIAVEGR